MLDIVLLNMYLIGNVYIISACFRGVQNEYSVSFKREKQNHAKQKRVFTVLIRKLPQLARQEQKDTLKASQYILIRLFWL